MQRREFIGLIGATALSFPRPGYGQTKTDLPVVGLLLPLKSDATNAKDRITALRKGLQEAGFIEGTNYSLAVRFAEGDPLRYLQLAKELGALKSRAIVAVGFLNDAVFQSIPAAQLGFEFVHYGLNTIDDLESAFAAGLRDDVSAFFISGHPLLAGNLSRVMTSVTASHKPTVGPYPDWDAPGF